MGKNLLILALIIMVVIMVVILLVDKIKTDVEMYDLGENLTDYKMKNVSLRKIIYFYKTEIKRLKSEIEKLNVQKYEVFKATAYDLSINSCGKKKNEAGYGISANGTDLRGLDRQEAMAIAVDKDVIPLSSKVEVIFDNGYSKYNGVYEAVDTGRLIKGNIIDVFMGDFDNEETHKSVWEFGRQTVKIRMLE